MLSPSQRVLFALFSFLCLGLAARAFLRLYRLIAAGRPDTDLRFDHPARRLAYALTTTLTQSRIFRKRPVISAFHAAIFYGFVFYILVNAVDAIDGYHALSFRQLGLAGNLYTLCADLLSAAVLLSVLALVLRRFLLPARRDFTFNPRTLLHPALKGEANLGAITRDSLIVSAFILFHVGSRAIGAAAKLALEGPDAYAPFATLLSHLFNPHNAPAWRIFGYWGALGSVLAFLAYFPRSKHIHIFLAPFKYVVHRNEPSGVLPLLDLTDENHLGAKALNDLAWPRLLDAFACIQCNRCQDVCPATATGKSLSPSALEINKRMALNSQLAPSERTAQPSPLTTPLLQLALTPEALWACTTCGACLDICPVQDEPMLDLIDLRRHQVMAAGDFPPQLASAFRGMERAKNPWGLAQEKRLDWAAGLHVPTTDQNPTPDVLFWVGCAASYDPQAQKTARAFVQLLTLTQVDFAVLGKRECCTGDPARRAGNEFLYRQLADTNVATLNEIRPKLIVATCPHCLNSVGHEYQQIGGDYKVLHHTEYLETLIQTGRLQAPRPATDAHITYHDPCYLGRHNGIYEAPRNLLHILSNYVVELPRNRENSFCCGAGGAQFWKEEEPGTERISDNRFREAAATLEGTQASTQTLAVGCPFCKSMLESTPSRAEHESIIIKDIAELLWEANQTNLPATAIASTPISLPQEVPSLTPITSSEEQNSSSNARTTAAAEPLIPAQSEPTAPSATPERKKWTPKAKADPLIAAVPAPPADPLAEPPSQPAPRKAWKPKAPRTTPPEDPKT